MTLPQATAIQIESRQPSAAEILAYAASRRDKWFSPRREPVKREEPAPVIVMDPAPRRVWRQHDAHVAAWMEWRGHEPLAFLKMRCREMGVSYAEIIGESRARRLIAPRHALMVEVKLKFPHLSNPFIATMFRRDHTVIYHAMAKHGVHERRKQRNPRRIADLEAKVKKMFDAGESYSEIGFALDFHPTVVRRFLTKMGWKR